jgi:hypothetical protein
MAEAIPQPPVENWTNVILTMLFGAGQAVMSVQDAEDLASQPESE